MTHPLTPREKPLGQIAYDGWAQGLSGCEWDNQTETQKRAWSKAADAILTALASGSGDHAELARLAEEATPGPWKGRQPSYSEGTSYIESELPCINGLSAWFSVAIIPAPSPEELGYSDGAIDSDANAAFIAAANPSTVLTLLAENAALTELYELTGRQCDGWKTRATEAERKLAEAAGLLGEFIEPYEMLDDVQLFQVLTNGHATRISSARTFLSKEAERG